MDKHQEQFDRMAKLVFGHGARIGGTIGSARGPGVLEIRIDDRTIGRGSTFATALADVTTRSRTDAKAVA